MRLYTLRVAALMAMTVMLLPDAFCGSAAAVPTHLCNLTASGNQHQHSSFNNNGWVVTLDCHGDSIPTVAIHPNATFTLNGKRTITKAACGPKPVLFSNYCLVTFCGGGNNVALRDTQITGVNNSQLIGIMCAVDGANLQLNGNTRIQNNTALQGALHVVGASTKVSLTGGILSNNLAQKSGAREAGIAEGCGGAAFVSDGASLSMIRAQLRDNNADGDGGALYVANGGKLDIKQTLMTGNHGSTGGAIAAINGSATLNRSTASGNSATWGGAILADNSTIHLQSCQILNNTIFKDNNGGGGGAMFIKVDSNVTAVATAFSGNTALSGGGLYLDQDSRVKLRGCQVFNNTSIYHGAGLYVQNSSVELLEGTSVDGNVAQDGSGGGLFVYRGSKAQMSNVQISNNTAKSAGGIHVNSDQAKVVVRDSNITDNSALEMCAGIYAATNVTLEVARSRFQGNSAQLSIGRGGAICGGPGSNITVEASVFRNNTAQVGGAITLDGTVQTTLLLSGCQLIGNVATATGGALRLGTTGNATIKDCTMEDNKAARGGAISLEETSGGKGRLRLSVLNSTMRGNKAFVSGGALDLNCGVVTLLERTVIMGNNAQLGGGVSLMCTRNDSLLNISSTCQISMNKAVYTGGGMWAPNTVELDFATARLVTYKNTAQRGHDDISMPPSQLRLQDLKQLLAINSTVVSSFEPDRRDGKLPPFKVKAMTTDGEPMGGVRIVAHLFPRSSGPPQQRKNIWDEHSPAMSAAGGLLGSEQITGTDGLAHFGDLKPRASPGDYTIKIFAEDFKELSPSVDVDVTVRACVAGEIRGIDTCQLCASGTYSFNTSDNECKGCPDRASCNGGSNVSANAGYWMSSNTSEQIHACPNREACQPVKTDSRATEDGVCAVGYEGILCGSCAKGYGVAWALSCKKCRPAYEVVLLSVFSGLGLLIFMQVSVHLALKEGYKPSTSLTPGNVIKIVVRHLQQLQLISEVQLDWPQQLLNSTRWIAWLLKPGASASLECILQVSSGQVAVMRVVMWLLVIPSAAFILLIVSQLVCHAIHYKWRRKELLTLRQVIIHLRKVWMVTGMTCLFFFYPNMVAAALGTMACIQVDSTDATDAKGKLLQPGNAIGKYWLADMQQRCWTRDGTQMKMSLGFGIIGTLLLCIVLPLAVFLVVYRHRNDLEDARFARHFGSMVSDYKPEYAWWEGANLLQLALLVAVGTFGKVMGGYLNLLCIAGAQLLCILAQALWQPQRLRRLHWLQTLAYTAGLLVAYIGLSYFKVYDARPADTNFRNVSSSFLVAINATLLLYLVIGIVRACKPEVMLRAISESMASMRSLDNLSKLFGISKTGMRRGACYDAGTGGPNHDDNGGGEQQAKWRPSEDDAIGLDVSASNRLDQDVRLSAPCSEGNDSATCLSPDGPKGPRGWVNRSLSAVAAVAGVAAAMLGSIGAGGDVVGPRCTV